MLKAKDKVEAIRIVDYMTSLGYSPLFTYEVLKHSLYSEGFNNLLKLWYKERTFIEEQKKSEKALVELILEMYQVVILHEYEYPINNRISNINIICMLSWYRDKKNITRPLQLLKFIEDYKSMNKHPMDGTRYTYLDALSDMYLSNK